jgi:DNA-binding NtrC family response regulator/CHASE2 domain-containing sensor protein
VAVTTRRRRALQTLTLGVVAAALALGAQVTGLASLDALAYARWRRPAPPSGGVLLVSGETEPATAGDHAALARLIGRLSRAGAAAIVADIPPRASRSGAAGEVLLRQTVAQARNVVGVRAAPDAEAGTGLGARAVGHTSSSDADGLVAIPAFVTDADGRIPALGLAAAAVALNVEPSVEAAVVTLGRGPRINLDARGRVLVSPSDGLPTTTLGEVARMASGSDPERLPSVVSGKLVFVLGEPARAAGMRLHAELASAVLTGSTLAPAPLFSTWIVTLALAVAAAWLWLTLRWWVALALTLLLALTVAGAIALLLGVGVVAPLTAPLAALVVASLGALGWRQLDERRRLGGLEGEVRALREALARQESTVETLEEDLDAARAAVARSAGAERELVRAAEGLRSQLEEARAQEEQTRRRLEALAGESRAVAAPAIANETCARLGIVTRDPAMHALVRDLEKAARSSLPILIMGEPGTGKELFARAAHRLSARAAAPFVAVNMAAIPSDLFESELFGHVRGSFTGAVADRRGWFEQADRGTIFLDEVGELRADHQAKLLRVLQEKSFHRVGAVRPTTVDVRVVAATNRDLERAVADGGFREDLYFRLKGLVLRLPPLRERRGDIAVLAERLLQEAAVELKRPGLALSAAALVALERHDWPGNVRELQNCLRQAAALADRELLSPGDLRLVGTPASASSESRDSDAAVLAALRRHRFDMQATARALGWDRSTVTQRLKGLAFRALVDSRGDAGRAAAELAADPSLTRAVELKLREYHEHLLRTVEGFDSADAAIAAARRRFKNLPERHFRSLETLLQRHFSRPTG